MTTRKYCLADGRTCLLVAMDFEGLGSWERTESEDMLLSLLSAAITNVTLYKTHFTFDRNTCQTLQRFNLGAPKVRAMCGGAAVGKVFNGDIVFCLKDVVESAVAGVKAEVCWVIRGYMNHLCISKVILSCVSKAVGCDMWLKISCSLQSR